VEGCGCGAVLARFLRSAVAVRNEEACCAFGSEIPGLLSTSEALSLEAGELPLCVVGEGEARDEVGGRGATTECNKRRCWGLLSLIIYSVDTIKDIGIE
jgi:hypothetical protein